jgi:Ca2+-binding EF-hand superfamily protein
MVCLAAAATSVFAVAGARLARSSVVDDAFAAMDTNHDGLVSRDELGEAARTTFSRSDVGGPMKLFEELDANHDGVLTRDELAAGQATLRARRVGASVND